MSTFVDFEDLKARVKIEQTIPLLGLKMRQHGDQYRGPCPACKSGGDRALAINSGKAELLLLFPAKGWRPHRPRCPRPRHDTERCGGLPRPAIREQYTVSQ